MFKKMRKIGLLKFVVIVFAVCIYNESPLFGQMSYLSDTMSAYAKYKGSVEKQMKAGDYAFSLEQYVIAVDRYKRALSSEHRDNVAVRIQYKIGLVQRKLNHPKESYDAFNVVWNFGERSEAFLRAYTGALQMLCMYDKMRRVADTMDFYKMNTLRYREILKRIDENTDSLFMISRSDIQYQSGINTAFSEYGMALVEDELIFSSTRALPKETVMDPKTGHGYSRLYSAKYRPESKDWAYPTLLQGETLGLEGNIGTFSYDSLRNIAYFMWSQNNKSGIYTLKRQGDGTWGELAEFELNYNEGSTSFAGRIGHPCVSKDGNRLLFALNDVDLGTATDIWYVERTAKSQEVKIKKRRVNAPAAVAVQKKTAPKKKKGSTAVIVNGEWELPMRLSGEVNTKWQESFPEWIDDYAFSFSSDGLIGLGGLDLYVATFDTNYKNIVEVMSLPAPINSSFDDHGLVLDKLHKAIMFSSNRYVGPGHMDNIYVCSKTGLVLTIDGEVNDSSNGAILSDYVATLVALDGSVTTAKINADGVFSFPSVGEGKYKVKVEAPGYQFKEIELESGKVNSVLPIIVRKHLVFSVLPTGFGDQNLSFPSDEGISLSSVDTASPAAANLAIADSLESANIASNKADTTGLAASLAAAAASNLASSNADAAKLAAAAAAAAASLATNSDQQEGYESFALAVQDKGKQDLSVFLSDSLTPKEIIDSINKHRKDISRVDSRYVNDYKQRVNDPLRRSKLQVVPPGAKCDVCENKTKQREADKPFFVRTGDDKALITMKDNAGNTSYMDLAPNAAYSIEITSMPTVGDNPSLPKSVQMSDIRKTVVTRDYVLFECAPKLAELNDETYVNNLYFDFDKDSLINDATRELDRMIIIAIKNPNMMFEIEAHADERGTDEYNKELTDNRLSKAASYVEKKGFDGERIVGKSYGKAEPLIKNAHTESEHALNRRVSFRLFNSKATNELKGKPYPIAESGIAFSNKISFRVQLGAFRHPLEDPLNYYQDVVALFKGEKITYYVDKDGLYKYNLGGTYDNIEKARALTKKVLEYSRECYIAAFYKGNRITVAEALAIINHKN